ncbi:unnamed protein product [Sphagnum balticum]
MIKIGTTENVYISKQVKNEKGTLEITIDTSAGQKKLSLIEQANAATDATGSGTTLMLFMPSMAYQNEQKSPEKLLQSLTNFKAQMHHILKRFTTETSIKWNVFKGIILKDDDDLMNKIQDEKVYGQVYTNIVDQFIEQAEKFKINDPAKKSRILLIRQSKEKGFGKLRETYLESQPFFEDMAIPQDKSKLWVKAGSKGATSLFEPDANGYVPAFSDYEISKGLDNPIMSSTKADAGTNTPEEAAAVESVFGAPAAPIDFSAPVEDAPTFGMPTEASVVPGLTFETEPEILGTDIVTSVEGE